MLSYSKQGTVKHFSSLRLRVMGIYSEENDLLSRDIAALTFFINRLSIHNEEFENCVKEVFDGKRLFLKTKDVSFDSPCILLVFEVFKGLFRILKHILSCVFVVLFIYLFIVSHNTAQKFVMRHCQNYIYPTMRTLRIWTLPLLQNYEFLSDWHEEECLVKNPFYYELPLDCWPCKDVRTLVDLSGYANYSSDYVFNEQPFIVRDSLFEIVTFRDLKILYKDYNLALDRGTARFLCSEKDFCSPNDVFTKKSPSKNTFQVMWKINRVAAAHVVRKIFPRPYFIPNNSEVALERYLYLSGPEAPQFFLPLTDFANVWVAQGQGYRLIVLDPSVPCTSNCSTVSVLLRPRDVLYYNWQFWRPRSRPANFSQEMSVTYVGSFY